MTIADKNLNFVYVFLFNWEVQFLDYIRINNHAIKLIKNEQEPYKPIYNLWLEELPKLKTYIKINLANSFTKSLKNVKKNTYFFYNKI